MVIELSGAQRAQEGAAYEQQASDACLLVGRVLAEIAAAREAADEGNVRGRAQRIAAAMTTLSALQWSAES